MHLRKAFGIERDKVYSFGDITMLMSMEKITLR
jgi:hypothetical protein